MEDVHRSEYARLTLLACYWYHRWEEELSPRRDEFLRRAEWLDNKAHSRGCTTEDVEAYTTLYERWVQEGKTTLAALVLAHTQEIPE